MIHLKLYGLPRTGSNAVAHNIEMTWPGQVRVWHDGSPSGAAVWKHGPPVVLSGIDGYVLCHRPYREWRESFLRWNGPTRKRRDLNAVIDERWLWPLWLGYEAALGGFIEHEDISWVAHWHHKAITPSVLVSLLGMVRCTFGLPEPEAYHVVRRYMARGGDDVPPDERTTSLFFFDP